ncbi:MAG: hypothetical protein O3A00_11660 [Planctomycetota bacterium]|nr:hypothetical protein [Planctomycetota bacterium]
MSIETVRVNITIPIAVKEFISEYARSTHRNMSTVMSEAIQDLARRVEAQELDRQLELAYRAMGDQLQAEVAEWDPASAKPWDRVYSDESAKRQPNRRASRTKRAVQKSGKGVDGGNQTR